MHKIIVCIFKEKGKYLFEKRWDNEDNYAGLWTFPMGHVKFLETKKHAVKREMSEELKIKLKQGDFVFLCNFIDHDFTSKEDYEFYVFRCKNYEGKIKKTYEQEKLAWLSIENAKKRKLSTIAKKIILRIEK